MGMTHHWDWVAPPSATDFTLASEAARVCALEAKTRGIDLAGWNTEGDPLFAADEVAFNGRGEAGYESFTLTPDGERGFCKVAGIATPTRRYSSMVVATLAAFFAVCPDTFCPHTEDTEAGIQEGIEIAEAILAPLSFDAAAFRRQMLG